MDPILTQKQVRDNMEELESYMNELKNWEEEIKRMDKELISETSDSRSLPPKRNVAKKVKKDDSAKGRKTSKIRGSDYASWDKFDADKACEDLDHSDVEEDSEDEEIRKARLRDESLYEKDKGNVFVKSQKWKEAIECYNKAIECYPSDAAFFSNRALCYIKTGDLELAESDCTEAIELDNSYVKAYLRRAMARIGLKRIGEAKEDFTKALNFEPRNSVAITGLSNLEKISKDTQKDTEEKITSKQQTLVTENELKHEKETGECKIPGVNVADVNWPTKEPVKVVNTVYKPPHLRSKRPLKRIKVSEVDGITTSVVSSDMSQKEEIAETEVRSQRSPPKTNDFRTGAFEPSAVHSVGELPDNCTGTVRDIPPLPQSFIQFSLAWQKVKLSPDLSYLYLKQISGEQFREIFLDSLDDTVLEELLEVFVREFMRRGDPVYSYLLGITKVKRFAAIFMFLSPQAKQEQLHFRNPKAVQDIVFVLYL